MTILIAIAFCINLFVATIRASVAAGENDNGGCFVWTIVAMLNGSILVWMAARGAL